MFISSKSDGFYRLLLFIEELSVYGTVIMSSSIKIEMDGYVQLKVQYIKFIKKTILSNNENASLIRDR